MIWMTLWLIALEALHHVFDKWLLEQDRLDRDSGAASYMLKGRE